MDMLYSKFHAWIKPRSNKKIVCEPILLCHYQDIHTLILHNNISLKIILI